MLLSINTIRKTIGVGLIFLLIPNFAISQQFNLSSHESTMSLFGTSSLHDWHITTTNYNGNILLNDITTCDIKACDISITSESLKSGKKSMDKNTYKALKTDAHKTINFKLTSVDKVTSKGNGKLLVNAKGNLTITGVKKAISIDFIADTSLSNTISLTGEKTIKMTDFNIDPPKALLGTITTGDEITIKFKSIFK
ncbi:MAG: YceI family protein [Tamlana sp.]|jgi:polyisoprenoid-binding protein YceI